MGNNGGGTRRPECWEESFWRWGCVQTRGRVTHGGRDLWGLPRSTSLEVLANLKENKQTCDLADCETALCSEQGRWSVLSALTDIPGTPPSTRPDKRIKISDETSPDGRQNSHALRYCLLSGKFRTSLLTTLKAIISNICKHLVQLQKIRMKMDL